MNRMCKFHLAACLGLYALLFNLNAATTWTGAVDNDILDPLNWDAGVPNTPGNVGTIDIDTGTMSISSQTPGSLYIIQQAGTLAESANNTWADGSWQLDSGAALTHGGGRLRVQNSFQWTINGGSLTANQQFDLQAAGTSVVFAGGGALFAENLTGSGFLNWQTGTTASMQTGSTTASNWAQTLYDAGRLRFDGDDNTALGLTWMEATSGGTQIWDYDVTSQTLTVIPEPSSLLLIGMAFLSVLALRGRRRA